MRALPPLVDCGRRRWRQHLTTQLRRELLDWLINRAIRHRKLRQEEMFAN